MIQKTDPLTLCRIALSFHSVFSEKVYEMFEKVRSCEQQLNSCAKHHVKESVSCDCENVSWPRGMNSISASSIPQSDSGVLVFMLVSKLLANIASINCDCLYYNLVVRTLQQNIVILTRTLIELHRVGGFLDHAVVWFMHFLRNPARKQIRPTLQLPGAARASVSATVT